jgi:hypothetical protein
MLVGHLERNAMREIIVHTQKELDVAVKEKDVEIVIQGTTEWLSVYGNATIQYVYGNATIQSVSDNATIRSVSDNATIRSVSGNATIKYVYGNATIRSVYGNATIQYVSDNATIRYVYGNATIRSVSGNATIRSVSDNATIQYVYDNATIRSVSGNATIKYVYGNATIKIFSVDVCIESVSMLAVIIMIGCVCKIKNKQKTVTVIKNKRAEYTKKDFIAIYGCDKDGCLTLYKSVNPKNGRDFHSNTIKYKGVVTCPNWNPDNDIECGEGLHLSPLPELALHYNQGKLLKCKVHKNDFVVYPKDITKVRCKKVTVIGKYNND